MGYRGPAPSPFYEELLDEVRATREATQLIAQAMGYVLPIVQAMAVAQGLAAPDDDDPNGQAEPDHPDGPDEPRNPRMWFSNRR